MSERVTERKIGETHVDCDSPARQGFGVEPCADAVGEMMERLFEDALDPRLSSERRLCAGRVRAPAFLDFPRIAVPREWRKKDPKTGRRRILGTFGSRAAAERHERAVQFFKRR